MIIDGHAHAGGDYRDASHIIKALDEAGADRLVLCPKASEKEGSYYLPHLGNLFPDREMNFFINRFIRLMTNNRRIHKLIEKGNETVFTLAKDSGGRVLQFYWTNPLKMNFLEESEALLKKWKFKGIKLHQACHPFTISSSSFIELTEWSASKNLPIFLHPFSREEVRDLIVYSKNLKTPLIIGHLIGLDVFTNMKSQVSEHIFFDISCPPLISEKRLLKAIEAFGAGRLIMGSDSPYGTDNLKEIIQRIRSLSIPEKDKNLMLGENLQNILGLKSSNS
jgi:uncharacterized protein